MAKTLFILNNPPRFPGVYAIGDVVAIPLALGKPLPKAGVFAHGEAEAGRSRRCHCVAAGELRD